MGYLVNRYLNLDHIVSSFFQHATPPFVRFSLGNEIKNVIYVSSFLLFHKPVKFYDAKSLNTDVLDLYGTK